MVKNIIGYIIAIIGIIAIATFLFEPVKSIIDPFLPKQITTTTLLITGVILLIIGIFLITRGSESKRKKVEVPIYEGTKIVGYRKT